MLLCLMLRQCRLGNATHWELLLVVLLLIAVASATAICHSTAPLFRRQRDAYSALLLRYCHANAMLLLR